MKNYQTLILKEAEKQPTKADLESIILQRTYHPSKNDKFSLDTKEAGEFGEQLVYNYLKYHGKDDWTVIRNIWMFNGDLFEGDIILLTNHGPYLFEVKNYRTDYKYENGVSTWNDNYHSGNPINQTYKNAINLEKIFQGTKVEGILMLIGVDNYVEINSEIPNIKVIKRNELEHTIRQIVKKDNEYTGPPFNNDYLLNQLEKYETYRRQNPKPLTDYQISRLRKGIYCLHCKSFNVKISRKEVTCGCGFAEKNETAILRTICEYGVLTFDRNLKVGKLVEFFGGQISRGTIRKILKKYFVEHKNGSHTSFINRILPLHKLYEEIKIESSITLTLEYREYERLMRKVQLMEKALGWID